MLNMLMYLQYNIILHLPYVYKNNTDLVCKNGQHVFLLKLSSVG